MSDVPPEITRDQSKRRRRRGSGGRRPRRSELGDEPVRYTVSSIDAAQEVAAPRTRAVEHAVPPTRTSVDLDDQRMDSDAAKVVRRLSRHGYEAYLVGGCVRDMLLGKTPKDFDVATSARPEHVRDIFRNSRIIGRRFKLVHVLFGPKVIETATFRRNPGDAESAEGDLLIRDDNEFGDAHEDAERRDFTINALFYDLQTKEVLDWSGGMEDIRRRSVRTLGEPTIRFKEDPVRMLRAIKFSARLDLGIEPETYRAIVSCRGALAMAARPRLFEEILRLLRGGAAHRSMWLCWELGVLDILLPELSSYLYDAGEGESRVWGLLDYIDSKTRDDGRPPDDVLLLTLLLLEPLREACDGERDRATAARDFLEPLVERLSMPRRIVDSLRRIVAMLPRLDSGKHGKLARTALFDLAQDVLAASRRVSPHQEGLFGAVPSRRRKPKPRRQGASQPKSKPVDR